ncbi:M-phase inducer phosphatase 1-B [Latimeria chalumnae]|uniref:M-phase inducer phosphatase 1-B n=1 Tax=Latimeria chalumnae TaxID=7897 RepID=UPI0006D926B6|nr:PREDICTED: M-phase inducer phosphatase 3 [Latimeria chalumnae]|eukprot:XP_014341835.1 PREDICTED: M-phase inducer phosphatase 3 [Latimeria chalumnae]
MSENPSCSSHVGLVPSFRSNCRTLLNLVRESQPSLSFSPEQPMSPVTSLTFNMNNLSAFAGDTPRRCLDLSNLSSCGEAVEGIEHQEKTQTGQPDSPHPLELNTPGQCKKVTPESEKVLDKNPHIGRFRSLLPRFLCSSPKVKNLNPLEGRIYLGSPVCDKENDYSRFKKPCRHAPQSSYLSKTATNQLLPVSLSSQRCLNMESCAIRGVESPITQDSLCLDEPINECEELDGITEIFQQVETEPNQQDITKSHSNISMSSMAILLSGPLMSQDMEISEVSTNRGRLFRFPSMPEKLNRPMLKRSVGLQGNETPVKTKRRKSIGSPIEEECENYVNHSRRSGLKRTLSLCNVDNSNVSDEDVCHRQLIGDFSKVYALPTVTGQHQDLKYITGEMMAAMLCGEFLGLIEKYYIIDCRYPYEYDGGHIMGALNLYRQDDIFNFFLKDPIFPTSEHKRIILLFHCEFSSERGPKMCRFLRGEDRNINEYPSLYYPELYVLKGGYKKFFHEFKEFCEPQAYCPMHHEDFREKMLKFRSKSKSWAGERRRREQITRLMKF